MLSFWANINCTYINTLHLWNYSTNTQSGSRRKKLHLQANTTLSLYYSIFYTHIFSNSWAEMSLKFTLSIIKYWYCKLPQWGPDQPTFRQYFECSTWLVLHFTRILRIKQTGHYRGRQKLSQSQQRGKHRMITLNMPLVFSVSFTYWKIRTVLHTIWCITNDTH